MTDQGCYRGIIHCHSRYSFDSVTSLESFLKLAKRESLDFVILTDHNTISGSVRLREMARDRGLPLEVPVAAEYATDHGDLIVAFVEREIESREFAQVVAEARAQGGLILLPHPFHRHDDPESLARHCDLIEVYNGHTDSWKNEAASALADSLGRPGYWGADAHLARELGNVVIEVERAGSLKESLAAGRVKAVKVLPSSSFDKTLSQFVRAVKKRDVVLFVRLCVRPLSRAVKSLLRRERRSEP